jgi:hypothetical protein
MRSENSSESEPPPPEIPPRKLGRPGPGNSDCVAGRARAAVVLDTQGATPNRPADGGSFPTGGFRQTSGLQIHPEGSRRRHLGRRLPSGPPHAPLRPLAGGSRRLMGPAPGRSQERRRRSCQTLDRWEDRAGGVLRIVRTDARSNAGPSRSKSARGRSGRTRAGPCRRLPSNGPRRRARPDREQTPLRGSHDPLGR